MICFIQQEESGPIKIGYTNADIKKRLYQLRTSNPYQLNLLGIIEGNKTREGEIHKRFSKHHIKNEWFHPSPEINAYMVDEITEGVNSPDKKFGFDLNKYIGEIEKRAIEIALNINSGNVSKTAIFLKITRPTLHAKIKKYF